MKFLKNSQKGGVEIFIMVVIILIAFLMAGGEFLLGNAFPLPDSLGIGSGTPVTGGNGGGDETQGPINIQNKGCIGAGNNRVSATTVIITNPTPGYISLEISNGAGGFATVDTHEFRNTPTSVYELNLPNELGFNNTPWRIRLFEGGTNSNGDFSGGTEKTVQNGTPTNC